MRLLVAGGAGFIGSNFVRRWLAQHPGDSVRVLDKLTYAGRRENLAGAPEERCQLIEGDIADRDAVGAAIEGCDAALNFAAESHVDRSIESPGEFISTDVYGTYVLLEAAKDSGLRYLQISTDEVYGDLASGSASEARALEPSSPYSASKAGADLIVAAFVRTFGADALIARPSNNYGPYQHPEKLIPLCILNALAGDALPVYGDGMQERSWLYVDDCCAGIETVLLRGESGLIYNLGADREVPNLEVVRRIVELTGADESRIEHVADRPGHDRRYSLSSEKARALGWEPVVGLEDGLRRTVDWYRGNEAWWEPIRSGEYRDYYERQYGRALG